MARVRRFRQAERTAARVIEGTAYVVGIDRQIMLELNEVGTFVWEQLAEPATMDGLASRVASVFEVSEEAARVDVRDFLDRLLERGVVLAEDSSA